jgi:adenine-specific DNA methylase
MQGDLFGTDLLGLDAETDLLISRLFKFPINYVGNKKRLLRAIAEFLSSENIEFDSVFDAFSGSGVVSLMFSMMGKKVISNDLLSSSALNAVMFLETRCIPLLDGDAEDLVEGVPPDGSGDFMQLRHKQFFDPAESEFLDRYKDNLALSGLAGSPPSFYVGKTIDDNGDPVDKYINLGSNYLPSDGSLGNPHAASFAMYAICSQIMSKCFLGGRYYKGQTLSRLDKRLERSEGSLLMEDFKAALSPRAGKGLLVWDILMEEKLKQEPLVFNCDTVRLLESGCVDADLVYLDPPYGGASSNYTELYTVCEEYVRGGDLKEDPELQEASARFKKVKGYRENFDILLDLCQRFPSWVISFNESSYASIDDIVDQVSKFGRKVSVKAINDSYVYNYRKDSKGSKEGEFLISARRL